MNTTFLLVQNNFCKKYDNVLPLFIEKYFKIGLTGVIVIPKCVKLVQSIIQVLKYIYATKKSYL